MAFDIPFVIQDGQTRSISQGQQRLVNMYPHIVTPEMGQPPVKSTEGKKQIVLQTTPGLVAYANAGGSEGRGCIELNGVVYLVIDNTFYTLDANANLTAKGTISTVTGVVNIAAGPDQLCLVDGAYGYCYTISTGVLAQITDVNFPTGATHVSFMQGYFIANYANTQVFGISAINNCASWSDSSSLAMVASKSGYADNLVVPFVLNEQLWLLGEQTTEIWYNSGAALFPFQQISGAFNEFGIAAKNSVAIIKNTLIWLTKTKKGALSVVMANQLIPQPVTTEAIAYKLSRYTTISDAEAFVYEDQKHAFYVLTFPTEGVTWVYDVTENLWHERSSRVNGVDTRWLIRNYFYFNAKHYGICYNSGKVYQIDMETFTEDSQPIYRIVQSFPLYQSENRVSIHKLILDVENNCGVNGGSEQITLEVSRDGGYNFETGLSVAASRYQDFTSKVIWRSLGAARSWVFRFTTHDAIKWIFLGIIVSSDVATE